MLRRKRSILALGCICVFVSWSVYSSPPTWKVAVVPTFAYVRKDLGDDGQVKFRPSDGFVGWSDASLQSYYYVQISFISSDFIPYFNTPLSTTRIITIQILSDRTITYAMPTTVPYNSTWKKIADCVDPSLLDMDRFGPPEGIRRSWNRTGIIWAMKTALSASCACAGLGLMGLCIANAWRQRRDRLICMNCSRCGYSLRGLLTDICPECGCVVDAKPDHAQGLSVPTTSSAALEPLTPPSGCDDASHPRSAPR